MLNLKWYRTVGMLLLLMVSAEAPAARKLPQTEQSRDQLPAAVQLTLDKQAVGVRITDVRARTKKTGVTYRIRGTAQGKNYDWEIDESGNILNGKSNTRSAPRGSARVKKGKGTEVPYEGPAIQ